jgi:hypothetical protein
VVSAAPTMAIDFGFISDDLSKASLRAKRSNLPQEVCRPKGIASSLRSSQ